ncbi:MAG: hypothetical protein ABR600_12445, partial [Actinomycetota bacterium]
MGLGAGDSDGVGVGDGVGSGVGVGSGGVLTSGVGLGDGVFVGWGAGDATVCSGCSVNTEKSGSTKSRAGIPTVTAAMKSCQISAGIVPPNTAETP